MVEYVLKNPVEAKRVEITKPPKPFALKTFDAQQDESVAAELIELVAVDISLTCKYDTTTLYDIEGLSELALIANHLTSLQL